MTLIRCSISYIPVRLIASKQRGTQETASRRARSGPDRAQSSLDAPTPHRFQCSLARVFPPTAQR
eukprot:1290081-Pleurochrysis_carterae.AAC.4